MCDTEEKGRSRPPLELPAVRAYPPSNRPSLAPSSALRFLSTLTPQEVGTSDPSPALLRRAV